MEKDDKNGLHGDLTIPQPSSSDLRGRQSVRATFKLSGKAISALSIVSVHLGIKQKSLFDHLIEDTNSLNLIAKEAQTVEFNLSNRVQKTYVLSRKTLFHLERTSKVFQTSRDALVEYSIQRLLPLIAKEKEKHRKRKEILKELTEYLETGKGLLKRTRNAVGVDDPVYERIELAMGALFNAYGHVTSFVEKGEIIEDF